jgi:hypothetical protein
VLVIRHNLSNPLIRRSDYFGLFIDITNALPNQVIIRYIQLVLPLGLIIVTGDKRIQAIQGFTQSNTKDGILIPDKTLYEKECQTRWGQFVSFLKHKSSTEAHSDFRNEIFFVFSNGATVDSIKSIRLPLAFKAGYSWGLRTNTNTS